MSSADRASSSWEHVLSLACTSLPLARARLRASAAASPRLACDLIDALEQRTTTAGRRSHRDAGVKSSRMFDTLADSVQMAVVRLLLLDADCFPAGRVRRFVRALQDDDDDEDDAPNAHGFGDNHGSVASIPHRSWCVEQSLQQLVWCSDADSDAANDVGSGTDDHIRDAQMRIPDASAISSNRTLKM